MREPLTIILVAMDFEFDAVADAANKRESVAYDRLDLPRVLEVAFDGGTAILARSGTGPIAAAITLSMLSWSVSTRRVLLLGVGGSLSGDLAIGDLVVADEIVQHDALFFGASGVELMAPGELHLSLDPKLRPAPQFSLSTEPLRRALADIDSVACLRIGQFVSGSSFAGTKAAKEGLVDRFPKALMVDMEAAGVALAARRLHLDLSVAKTVADRLDPAAGIEGDYLRFRDSACRNAAKVAAEFVNSCSNTGGSA